MKKKHCGRKVEMKQIKKVSLIGALVLIISAVMFISGCQQPNNTDGGDFSPFTGSNDNSLWKAKSQNAYYPYLYAQKGTIYNVTFGNDKVDSAPKLGTVANGKITITYNGATITKPVSIDGDELKIGSGDEAQRYTRIEDAVKQKQIKAVL